MLKKGQWNKHTLPQKPKPQKHTLPLTNSAKQTNQYLSIKPTNPWAGKPANHWARNQPIPFQLGAAFPTLAGAATSWILPSQWISWMRLRWDLLCLRRTEKQWLQLETSGEEGSRTGKASPSIAELLLFWGSKQSCNNMAGVTLPYQSRAVNLGQTFPEAGLWAPKLKVNLWYSLMPS